MAYYQNTHRGPGRGSAKSKKKLLFIAMAIVVGGLLWLFFFLQGRGPENTSSTPAKSSQEQSKTTNPPKKAEPEVQPVASIDLQPTIDSWKAKQSATYGIVVYDPKAKKVIGSNLADQQFFAASLYKLFVAYLALEDFQKGAQDPTEQLTGGLSRLECVDKMIRESHSPCGEAMMAAMGPAKLEQRVQAMGIKNTTFTSIKTTANDMALILQYILEKRDLDEQRTAFLRDAMRNQPQKYKNGLARGAPQAAIDSKVGWNETINYHDVGIFTLPDKREYIVAILSQGNGSSRPIADFASTIYAALTK